MNDDIPSYTTDPPAGDPKDRYSLASGFHSWLTTSRGLAPRTAKQYSDSVDMAARWLGEHRQVELALAASPDIEMFHESTKPAPATRRNIRSALVAFFEFEIARGARKDNPATGLPKARVRRGVPRPLEAELIPRLFDVVRQSERPEMWRAIFEVFARTGLRLNEVCSLRWDQIENGWATLVQKGGGERRVCLAEPVVEALTAWRGVSGPPSDFVFPSPIDHSRPVSINWIGRRVKAFGCEIGLERLTLHVLRHTFASHLYKNSKDLLAVSQALGHSNPQNTLIYTKLWPEDLRAAVDTLYRAGEPELQPLPPAAPRRSSDTSSLPFIRMRPEVDLDALLSLIPKEQLYPSTHAASAPEVVGALCRTYAEAGAVLCSDLNHEQYGALEMLEEILMDQMKWWVFWWTRVGLQIGAGIAAGLEVDYGEIVRAAARATDSAAEAVLFE